MITLKFIYCLDEVECKKLQAKGFKLIQETTINNQSCWVLENDLKIKCQQFDNKKMILSDKLMF